MEIRKAIPSDSAALAALAGRMWDADAAELEAEFVSLTADVEAACFLALDGKNPVGFAQCQLRHDYVEGCETSPVGFLEGIYVEEAFRRSGVAKMLLAACEGWAASAGCTEFASDCELGNEQSLQWHLNNGFAEMGRTIWFAKKL